ncbi:MAG: hypothetical protein JW920_03875 [Deltaproteobacteria bacterium]|nr:hypothetical protein [Deltaproteobacteria bacterium]
MDRHERVRLAMEHQEPDKVPTLSPMDVQTYVYDALDMPVPKNMYRYFISPFWGRIIDKTAPFLNLIGSFENDLREFMVNKIKADIKMGFDSTWNVYANIFRLKDSKHMYDIWGRLYAIVDDGYGNMATPSFLGGLFKSPQDWRTWNKKEWEAHPEKMYKYNDFINKEFGKDIYIFGSHLYGLFEQAWQPFGFKTFVKFLRKERPFLEEMIEYNKQWYLKCVDASADAGFPAIIYSDDMAFKNGPMLNPAMMDELFGAAFREITDRAHKKGVKIIIHTDGYTKPLLKYFVKWGFDGHHALEYNANVDLADFRKEIGHELVFLGHLDITHVLSFGSREEVFEHIREAIKKGGQGGGLILGPCNSHADIRVQNLKWMMEAIEEYGSYPLPMTKKTTD